MKLVVKDGFDAGLNCVIDSKAVLNPVLLKDVKKVFLREKVDGVKVRVRGRIKIACGGVGHVLVCEDCVRMIERIGAGCEVSYSELEKKEVVKWETDDNSIEFARKAIRKLFSNASLLV